MDYEKLYKEALERARQVHTTNIDENKKSTEYIFPVLKESEDEKIRKSLIHLLQVGGYMSKEEKTKAFAWLEKQSKENMIEALRLEYEKGKADGLQEQRKEWTAEDLLNRNEIADILQEYNRDDLIDWLEKQGEQKVPVNDFKAKDWYVSKVDGKIRNIYHSVDMIEPKFKVGDWIVNNNSGYVYQVTEIRDDEYCLWPLDTEIKGYVRIIDVDNYYHLWSINDAKDGDVLHSTGFHNDCIFIFNGLDKWKFDEPNGDRAVATGYCCLFVLADNIEFGIQGPDCVEVNTIKPATKIQRDLLFSKMKEAGYEWDAEKKDLKKISQEYPLTPDECTKSAWSEEDEEKFRDVIRLIEQGAPVQSMREHYTNWLKSLKERLKGE